VESRTIAKGCDLHNPSSAWEQAPALGSLAAGYLAIPPAVQDIRTARCFAPPATHLTVRQKSQVHCSLVTPSQVALGSWVNGINAAATVAVGCARVLCSARPEKALIAAALNPWQSSNVTTRVHALGRQQNGQSALPAAALGSRHSLCTALLGRMATAPRKSQ